MKKIALNKISKYFFRAALSILIICALYFSAGISPAAAAAPLVTSQAPGYYHKMLGQFEITALYDGVVTLNTKLLKNETEENINKLLNRMFIDAPELPTSVNAYLVNTGAKLVLIDAGAGKVFGPTLGNVLSNLKASGYKPEQVDAIFITHLHGDHIGGVLDDSGKPAYPNATIYVSKPESDFWLSAAEMEKAPEEKKQGFKIAQDTVKPYKDAGKFKTFSIDEKIIEGIKAVSIFGHTPGHTSYEIASGKDSILIIGDMVHNMAVQFSEPGIALDFDNDAKQAVTVRGELFKNVAKSKQMIAGMHIPFPGIGYIRDDGNNAYTWVPIEYSPITPQGKKY